MAHTNRSRIAIITVVMLVSRHKALLSQHRFGEGKSVIIIMKYPSSTFRGGVISCTVRVQLKITLLTVVAETAYYQVAGSAEFVLISEDERATWVMRVWEFSGQIKI